MQISLKLPPTVHRWTPEHGSVQMQQQPASRIIAFEVRRHALCEPRALELPAGLLNLGSGFPLLSKESL